MISRGVFICSSYLNWRIFIVFFGKTVRSLSGCGGEGIGIEFRELGIRVGFGVIG